MTRFPIQRYRNQLKGEKTLVNEDQAKGKIDEAKGAVREIVGKAIGNKDLEAKGRADKLKGKGRQVTGDVKHAANTIKHMAQDVADGMKHANDHDRSSRRSKDR